MSKFLGYSPRGCSPSTFKAYINISQLEDGRHLYLPMFSYIDTQKTDSRGRQIYFSIDNTDGNTNAQSDQYVPINLVNGKWKLYPTVFTASGVEYEQFVLDGLKSDSDEGKFVANDYFKVYIMDQDGKIDDEWFQDKNEIFTMIDSDDDDRLIKVHNTQSKVYHLYLNSDKTYEIKFGDGVVGKKLNKGDTLFIYYLDSNGEDGNIDITDIGLTNLKFQENIEVTEKIKEKFTPSDRTSLINNPDLYTLQLRDLTTSTASNEETVEEIRQNAPEKFKTGNRLITSHDYEWYIKNNRALQSRTGLNVIDVVCMNNMEYATQFYTWLYGMTQKSKQLFNSGSIDEANDYFSERFFTRTDYKYIDPSDSNNIYLWMLTTNDFDTDSTYETMNNELKDIKLMTTELQVLKPVPVNFQICAADIDIVREYLKGQNEHFDNDCESYIEVTLDDNSIYVGNNIKELIISKILKPFKQNNIGIGKAINYNDILNDIYSINGVSRVRTVFVNKNEHKKDGQSYLSKHVDGLSFASWTDSSVLTGMEDADVGNTTRVLQEFQYPVYPDQSMLSDHIKIIKKSMVNVNAIKM